MGVLVVFFCGLVGGGGYGGWWGGEIKRGKEYKWEIEKNNKKEKIIIIGGSKESMD